MDNTAVATPHNHPAKISLIHRIKGMNRLFLFTVAIPTLLSILYFGLIASDVYISESSFVIYTPGQSFSSSGLSSLLGSISGSNSSSTADTIKDYVDSWDAMTALDQTYHLKEIYGNHHIDIFNRFGGLFYPFTNQVELHRYYRGMVEDSVDSTSGITKLTVRAYTAADAQKINAFLLQKSQDIANRLNDTARRKAVYYAQNQVDIAQKNLRNATVILAQYRNTQKIFSPPAQSALQLGMISKLQDQLLKNKSQLDTLRTYTPSNPQLPLLASTIQSLETQIDNETSKVSGSTESLSSKDINYEGFLVDQLIAQKILEAAVTSLEQAKVTAQKQELYLETISHPNLPDASQVPKRFQDILATLLVSLIVWGALTVVVAGVREHHDR
ncbi:MAG: hypothetical protein ACYC0M_14610 [Burkholderiales bacterium]